MRYRVVVGIIVSLRTILLSWGEGKLRKEHLVITFPLPIQILWRFSFLRPSLGISFVLPLSSSASLLCHSNAYLMFYHGAYCSLRIVFNESILYVARRSLSVCSVIEFMAPGLDKPWEVRFEPFN